jgi:hypothetical protein
MVAGKMDAEIERLAESHGDETDAIHAQYAH